MCMRNSKVVPVSRAILASCGVILFNNTNIATGKQIILYAGQFDLGN